MLRKRIKNNSSSVVPKSNKEVNEKRRRNRSWLSIKNVVYLVGLTVGVGCIAGSLYNSMPSPKTLRGRQLAIGLPKKTCVITISAMNNFGFVSNLYDSVMTNSPSINCFIWFVGDASEPTDAKAAAGFYEIKQVVSSKKNFSLVTMNQMEEALDSFDALKIGFMFDLVEVQTTLKPFAFQYAFQKFGADAALYLDNDIWVTGSLEEIQMHLSTRSAVVTPHCSTPIPEDGRKQKDKNILASGVFNFGFVAFSNTVATSNFLKWWAERLSLYGFARIEQSMFYDQNWGMFIPSYFDHEDYYVIRDLRYNIAYWNLHERGAGLHMKNGLPHLTNAITKKTEKVVFMHFSGMSLLEKYDMEGISRHQNRYTLRDFPRIAEVFDAYMDLVSKHNTLYYRNFQYGYNNFSDGTVIEDFMRELYASVVFPVYTLKSGYLAVDEEPPYKLTISPYSRSSFDKQVLKNPFCASEDCHTDPSKVKFVDWVWGFTPAGKVVDLQGDYYVSPVETSVWNNRPDLRLAFPDPENVSHSNYMTWFKASAVKEGYLSERNYKKWEMTVQYHKYNHLNFHKTIPSTSIDVVGINVFGWHAGRSDAGISGAKIIRSANISSIPLNAIELDLFANEMYSSPNSLDFDLTRSCEEPINLIVASPATFVHAKQQIPEAIWKNKYNILYLVWELDVVPQQMMQFLPQLDEIWCASYFIKESIEKSPGYRDGTIIKVLPIPFEPAAMPIVKQDDKKLALSSTSTQRLLHENASTEPFTFFVDFDFKVKQRENPEAVIRAFLKAFPKGEDPQKQYALIVKSRFGTTAEIRKLKESASDDSRVTFVDGLFSHEQNQAFIKRQDCYVSLHRSEGYGMDILEAMGNGIPVIATNYGGNIDFFTAMSTFQDKCYFPISFEMVKLKESYGPYEMGNQWADPDLNAAVAAMRKVVQSDCKKVHGVKMSKQMTSIYGPTAVGAQLKKLISDSVAAVIAKQK